MTPLFILASVLLISAVWGIYVLRVAKCHWRVLFFAWMVTLSLAMLYFSVSKVIYSMGTVIWTLNLLRELWYWREQENETS